MGGHLAVDGVTQHGPVPVPEAAQADFPGAAYLLHADGDAPAGHVVHGSVEIPDGVGGSGLPGDFQHPGGQGAKLLRRQLVLGLVEGQVAVDADAAEADVHSAQRLNRPPHMLRVPGVRKNPLALRHHQLRLDFAVHRPVHEAPEAERVGFVDPLLLIGEIFVHIQEPYVFQADIFLVDHIHKKGILSHRTHRTDEYRFLAQCVFPLDLLRHFPGHGPEYGGVVLHDGDGQLRCVQQLLSGVVIIFVTHALPLFHASKSRKPV